MAIDEKETVRWFRRPRVEQVLFVQKRRTCLGGCVFPGFGGFQFPRCTTMRLRFSQKGFPGRAVGMRALVTFFERFMPERGGLASFFL